jgi:hypothetical protein
LLFSPVGKTNEVDMVVTIEHCSTDVGGEPVKHISKGIFDHTYDWEGFGIIFKLEVGSADVDNGTIVYDANPDDNKKPQEEEPKDYTKKSSKEPNKGSSSLDGSTENSNRSQVGRQAASVPPFNLVASSSAFDTCSEGRLKSIVPQKLWGDEEQESLAVTSAMAALSYREQ